MIQILGVAGVQSGAQLIFLMGTFILEPTIKGLLQDMNILKKQIKSFLKN